MRAAGVRGEPAALVALDVDGLREIDDRHGNARGGDAPRDVATVLRAATREPDVVARSGGGEFAVLTERDETGAAELVALLRRRLEGLQRDGRRPFKLSAGIGVAMWAPRQAPDVSRLLERAARELHTDG